MSQPSRARPAQGAQPTAVVLDNSTNAAGTSPSQTTGSNSSNGSSKGSGGRSTGSTGAKVPKGLESFYRQNLTWTDCPDGATGTAFQCATVTVPLDYDHPRGKTITVALKKLPSTSPSPRGSVFLNPGGPGGSGISLINAQAGLYKTGGLSGSWRTMTSSASTRAASASPPPSPAGPPTTFRRLWTGGPRHPPS